MSVPELAPRSGVRGIVAVWVVALLGAVAIAVFVPDDLRAQWFLLALGGSLILAFAVQLATGRSVGFIQRVAASVLGALVVMGLASVALGLAAIIPGYS